MRPVTGGMFAYYFVCKRKLWFFAQGITLEEGYSSVEEGKALEATTFSRESKNRSIDGMINVDFIDSKKVIHEIKKSDAMEESAVWQVRYYLYYLKKRGHKDLTGEIHYPLMNKITKVSLTGEDELKIVEILSDIERIISREKPPRFERLKICKSCAYFEFCLS